MSNPADLLPFDPEHFANRAAQGESLSIVDTFQQIYDTQHWSPLALSGEGASDAQTATLREALPALFQRFEVRTLIDAPCGDFGWMRAIDLTGITYIGLDIVPSLIAQHQQRFTTPQRRFQITDLLIDDLPSGDLLLCRDCLVHLSFEAIGRVIANLKRSSITYLLTTTFPMRPANHDITTGDWRVLNLEQAPFSFPSPLYLLNENCTEGDGFFADKSLGLWRIADLPDLSLS